MKFRALNTFTFLFILSFLFADVSGGLFDGLTKLIESKTKINIPPRYLRNLPDEELSKKYGEIGQKTKEKAEEMLEAMDYLEKYGFLNSSTSPSDLVDESSIIKFQKFFNLKNTGMLDRNTTDTLTKPRCGVPDNLNAKSFKPWWTGNQLTYAYPKDNVPNNIKSLFQNAFNRWSKVTGLNFTETMSFKNSNIKILVLDLDGKGKMVGGTYLNKAKNVGIMYFDINEQWSSKSDIKQDEVDFESVVMHQIGHLLGLEHSSVEEAIMYPIVLPKQKIELVNDDDLQKIQQIYGVQNDKSDSNAKTDASNSTVKKDASDSSWPVVFWPLGFSGFVVCFFGLL
ncbi:hypothetical protein RYX36_004767 [Vicia faba]